MTRDHVRALIRLNVHHQTRDEHCGGIKGHERDEADAVVAAIKLAIETGAVTVEDANAIRAAHVARLDQISAARRDDREATPPEVLAAWDTIAAHERRKLAEAVAEVDDTWALE